MNLLSVYSMQVKHNHYHHHPQSIILQAHQLILAVASPFLKQLFQVHFLSNWLATTWISGFYLYWLAFVQLDMALV